MHNNTCSVDGCDGKIKGHGFCEKHRYRFHKYGDPLAGKTFWGRPMIFLRSSVASESDDCISWPFNKNNMGYGMVRDGKKSALAHRMVCAMKYGPPPSDSHEAAHLCGNGSNGCINPRHLAWKTRRENEYDKIAHGTLAKGESHPCNKYPESLILRIMEMLKTHSRPDVARKLGVKYSLVRDVHDGRRWRHLSVDNEMRVTESERGANMSERQQSFAEQQAQGETK